MKTTALLVLLAVALVPAEAQSIPQKARARNLVRADFDTYQTTNHQDGAPGVKVQIELQRDGKRRIAKPTETFFTGDKIRFLITTNFDGRLVVANTEEGASPVMLLPMDGDDDQVKSGKVYTTPGFQFDENPGVETVALILTDLENSSEAESEFDSAAKSRSAWKSKGGSVLAKAKTRGVSRARGLIRVDDEDDTVILAADEQVFSQPTAVLFSLRHAPRR